ncbi:MAG: enoyl-CoA hydratase [Alphaproteobacteria bacterium]|nr:enoyl-CoA hydratase [Alphaproteobacteria bacterium]
MTQNATDVEATAALVDVRQDDDGVLVVTLSQPKTRNALSQAMMQALNDAVQEASSNVSVRAIVLAAAGPAFCAGHDLKELTAHRQDADAGVQFFSDTMQRCSELMQAIVACPKPVIAAVHATATAAGCQLVATCDLAVAATSAKFCTPGVNIGLFCSTPMVALSRNVGRKRAMEMLLLGDMISAEDAAAYGLINRVVDDGDVLATASEFAQKIARKSSATVATGKKAFYQQAEMPLAEAYDFASDVMVRNMMAADAKEGIGAFLEKRAPTWKD